LYGTTALGGSAGFSEACGAVYNGCGTVFRVSLGVSPAVEARLKDRSAIEVLARKLASSTDALAAAIR
jgi:hypothetical protein